MKSCLSLAFAVLLTAILAAQTTAPNVPAPSDKGKDKEPAKCTVAGQVVQEPGDRPMRKATIQLTPVDQDEGTAYTADSDAEGRFKFDNIRPGQYRLSMEHSGFSSMGKRRWGQALTLDPGQEMKDLVLRMQPSAVITGKIADDDGDPVSGVAVFVKRAAAARHLRFGAGYTNDLGEYRISDLAPGRYVISAVLSKQSFQRSEIESDKQSIPYLTYYPGIADRAQAAIVELHSGDEFPADFSLVYGPSFRVRGLVSGISTTEPRLSLILRSKDGEWPVIPSEVEVRKDGSFEINKVLPGSYEVWLMTMTSPAPETLQAAQGLEVKGADLENVRLTPAAKSEVRGQLRMENGQKVDWGAVTVVLDSGESDSNYVVQVADEGETSTQAKQDGSFDMKTIPPGNYRVMLYSGLVALRDCFVKSINAGGKDVANSGFTVSGGLWSLDVVVSAKGATVDGIAVDDKNQPVADADVVLIPDSNRQRRDLFQSAQTDQHGHFKLRGLNPGGYRILALEDLEEDFRNPEFLKAHEGAGQTLHVDEDERKSIVLKLESSGASLPN